jgi:broad specificity phosphatase PhoE
MLENSTILLVRHGEKPGGGCAKDTDGDVNLSQAGADRAQAYVGYLRSFTARTADGTSSVTVRPDFLFAARDGSSSHRPVETLTPLAQATGLPFDTGIKDADYATRLVPALGDGRYADSTVVICWHHGTLVQLAEQLLLVNGQRRPDLPAASTWPATYDCETFGWLFQIRYDANGIVQPGWTRCLNEQLMPDDTINPPGP